MKRLDRIINYSTTSVIVLIIFLVGYMLFEWVCGGFHGFEDDVTFIDIGSKGTIATPYDKDGNEIALWDGHYLKDKLQIQHTSSKISDIQFSKDEKLLVVAFDDNFGSPLKIWSVEENKVITSLLSRKGKRLSAFFNTKQNLVISLGYNNILIWDWKTDKVITIKGQFIGVDSNEQDMIAYTTKNSCELILFDLKTMKEIKTFPDLCGAPKFIPNSSVIALSQPSPDRDKGMEGTFIFFDYQQEKQYNPIPNMLSYYTPNLYDFSGDGEKMVTKAHFSIEVWNWKEGKIIHEISLSETKPPLKKIVSDMAFINNSMIAVSAGKKINILDIGSEKPDVQIIGDKDYVIQLCTWLYLLTLTLLIIGIIGVFINPHHVLSRYAVVSVLVFWSVGLFLIFNHFKRYTINVWLFILSFLSICFLSIIPYGTILLLSIGLPYMFGTCYFALLDKKSKVKITIFLVLCLIMSWWTLISIYLEFPSNIQTYSDKMIDFLTFSMY